MTHAPETVRLAYHEASHAAAAYIFGCPVALVSIRPGTHYAGITTWAPRRFPGEPPVELPAIAWPARPRRAIETSIVVLLAGRMGAMLRGWPEETGYHTSPDEEEAERATRILAGLTTRETLALTELETDTERRPPDEVRAARLSWAIAGSEEADMHLAYMRAVTRSVVSNPNFGRFSRRWFPNCSSVECSRVGVCGRSSTPWMYRPKARWR